MEVVQDYLADAPVDLTAMAEALGLEVDMCVPMSPEVSGRIIRRASRFGEERYRIEVNGSHHPRRQRFTLAHEIAHFLLHRDLLGAGIEDNEMYRSGLPDPIEWEADRYAAELLMPAKLVRMAYRAGATSVARLADAFDVSFAAMNIRLRQLKLAP
jgi:Zn-dependent peptidase ImmA (M78 family)